MKQGSFARCPSCMDKCYCSDRISGFIYFVACRGSIKIGYSDNPERRLAQLQNATPTKLRVIKIIRGNRYIEKALHTAFAKYRRHGEWFSPGPRLLAFMATLTDKQTIFIHDCNLLLQESLKQD